MAITGRPGIAATYGLRRRAPTRKKALKRCSPTDFFGLLSSIGSDIKGAAMRDFETRAGLAKKENGGNMLAHKRRKERIRVGVLRVKKKDEADKTDGGARYEEVAE